MISAGQKSRACLTLRPEHLKLGMAERVRQESLVTHKHLGLSSFNMACTLQELLLD